MLIKQGESMKGLLITFIMIVIILCLYFVLTTIKSCKSWNKMNDTYTKTMNFYCMVRNCVLNENHSDTDEILNKLRVFEKTYQNFSSVNSISKFQQFEADSHKLKKYLVNKNICCD